VKDARERSSGYLERSKVSHSEWLSWFLEDYHKRQVRSALYRASTNFRSDFEGVSKIETDVSTKTVIVEADESVAPQMMLEKLEKVSCRKK
jgi:hypothetical protein